MQIDKFRDQAVQHSLFRFASQDDLAMSMLRHWPENSRYNDKMARFALLLKMTAINFPDTLRVELERVVQELPVLYAGVDDHRAEFAIKAHGETIAKEAEKEKHGILGMLQQNENEA